MAAALKGWRFRKKIFPDITLDQVIQKQTSGFAILFRQKVERE
jgi:hypothetical protein